MAQGTGATLVPALAARWTRDLVLRVPADDAPMRRVRLVAQRHNARAGALDAVAGAARAIARADRLRIFDAAHQASATLTP